MQLDVYSYDNLNNKSSINVSDSIFGIQAINRYILAQVIRWQRLKSRQKSVIRKNRSEVVGSTRKIYRQKGTGNARHSSRYVSQFRGGGIAHGPVGQKAIISVPKKVRKSALKNALSLLVQNNKLSILDKIQLETVSTSAVFKKFSACDYKSILVIDKHSYVDNNFYKSIKNTNSIHYLSVDGMNVIDILKYDHVFIVEDCIGCIEKRLG